MPDTDGDPERTETDPPQKDDSPLSDPEQDKENIEDEGAPFPGNFA